MATIIESPNLDFHLSSVQSTRVQEIVFIDSTVFAYQDLIAGIRSNLSVFMINSSEDGGEKISNILSEYEGLTAIHLVSHGTPSQISLGNIYLNLETLKIYSHQLKTWANALSAGAELLIYGCEVAQGQEGWQFIQQLSQITGASVTASTTRTGSTDLGGDWQLETSTGNQTTELAFEPAILATYQGVLAAEPTLVADLNQTTPSSDPTNVTSVNGVLYFRTSDKALWKLDPATNDAVQVMLGNSSTANLTLVNVGGTLYFTAFNSANGNELWKIDPIIGNPTLIEVRSGSASTDPQNLTTVNGILYFTADDGFRGRELWRVNPTTGNPEIVRDLQTGINSSAPANLTNANGVLYFTANNGTNGISLWRLDSTTGSPVMVSGLGAGSSSANPNTLLVINNTLYFRSTYFGTEQQYRLDSTGNPVQLNQTINPTNLTNVNGTFYFTVNSQNWQLWKIDPANGNLVQVSTISTPGSVGSAPRNLTNVNGTLYFVAENSSSAQMELWKFNANNTAIELVRNFPLISGSFEPSNLINFNNTLYFTARNDTNGYELWKLDAAGNPVMVRDIAVGGNSSTPADLRVVDGALYFTADDGFYGRELWKINAAGNAVLAADASIATNASSPSNLTNVNGTVYFTANNSINGEELWKVNPATGQPVLLDISVGGNPSSPTNLTNVNGTLYFAASSTSGRELWKIDPTTGNPTVIDIVPGNGSSSPNDLRNINGTLYFTADDGTGIELWRIEPTSGNAVRMGDIYPGSVGSNPTNLTDVNGTLYFAAANNTNGRELWRINPATGVPVLVSDIYPNASSSDPTELTFAHNTLYFIARNNTNGRELWRINPTTGAPVVLDVLLGSGSFNLSMLISVGNTLYLRADGLLWKVDTVTSNPTQVVNFGVSNFTNVNGTLYFTGNDGTFGQELWRVSPSTGSAVKVGDIALGGNSSNPSQLTNVDGTLYFTANNNINGTELWKVDAATGNPVMVSDLNPGSIGSDPYLYSVDGTLYFTASNDTYGAELWTINPTTGVPVLVRDINPGSNGSSPSTPISANGKLYFSADNGKTGRELWVLDTNSTPALSNISKTGNEDTVIAFTVSEFTNAFNGAGSLSKIQILSLPTNGTLQLGTATITVNQEIALTDLSNLKFIPNANFNGSVDFNWRAFDGTAYLATTATVNVTVNAVNDIPTLINTISDQAITEDVNFTFTFAGNTFADIDTGTILNYTATQTNSAPLPSWITFNPTTRTFSGIPRNSDVGILNIQVTATDNAGASVAETFALTIVNSNDAPTVATPIADQSATTGAPFSLTFSANTFNDVDAGDSLTYSATLSNGDPLPTWLSFNPTTRTFNGTPLIQNVGTLGIRITATDVAGATVTDIFNITVSNTNNPPTISNPIADRSIAEDTVFNFTVPVNTFNDTDAGATLSYSATLANENPLPAWLAFNANTRTFSGTPLNANVGDISLKVIATDNAGASISDTFNLTVTNVNDAPIVANPITNQTTSEDAPFTFTIPANAIIEVDAGDTLTYAATLANDEPLPAWLTFNPSTRTFSGTPTNEQVGAIALKVNVTDLSGASVANTFNLTVLNTNDAPTLTSAITDQTATIGSVFNFPMAVNTFNDIDAGDTLTYTATLSNGDPLPSWLSFNSSTRTFGGTPLAQNLGTLSVQVTARDIAGATASDIFNLTVIGNGNNPPVVVNPIVDLDIAEDTSFSFTIPPNTFTDPDSGNTLTYTATLSNGNALPLWLGFDANTGTFVGTTPNNEIGLVGIRVTATDNAGANVSDTFNLTVTNTNDVPILVNAIADQTTTAGSPFNFTVAANAFNDIDAGDTLTYTAALSNNEPLPAWLNFNPATRTLNGTPGIGDAGTLNIRITATDTSSATVSDVFSLMVINQQNTAPTVANPIPDLNTSEDAAFSFTVPANTFNDADAGTILGYSATLANGDPLPSWLTFNPTTRTFSGTPLNSQVGALALRVTATDNAEASVSDTFNLTVTNTNDAPILVSAIADQSGRTGTAFSFTLPVNTFTDVDTGDSLTYTTLLENGNALPNWLSFNTSTLTLSGTPTTGDVGNLNIRIIATDRVGATVNDVFTLTITNPNSEMTTIRGTSLSDKLTGTSKDDLILGLDGDDIIKGSSGNDILDGANGNDNLDGGAGNDTMIGGLGNDTYTVDSLGDSLIEAVNAGTDLVRSSVSWLLGANLENLTLTGTQSINGTGNSLNNNLTGNDGANTLIGGDGYDTLNGGKGNDFLLGDALDDTLNGGGGDDLLNGGTGRDRLTGGIGRDRFDLTNTRAGDSDTLTDFNPNEDLLLISKTTFGLSQSLGTLEPNLFVLGSSSTTSNHRFIYNQSKGSLFFDGDGLGGAVPIQIAQLSNKAALSNINLVVVD